VAHGSSRGKHFAIPSKGKGAGKPNRQKASAVWGVRKKRDASGKDAAKCKADGLI